MIVRTALIALVLVPACAQLEPDVGPRLAGACDNEDSDPEADVSFATEIRPLLVRKEGGCGCHMPTSSRAGGLDLGSLPALRAGGTSGGRSVVAGEPCASVFYQKVADTPPFGSRMPLGGEMWTEHELTLLHDWIAEGAEDN